MTAPVIVYNDDQIADNSEYAHVTYIKRVNAFMMAWHPTVGINSIISKIISKDVGKWFCKEYMSREYRGIKISFGELRAKLNVASIPIYGLNMLKHETKLMIQTPVMKIIGVSPLHSTSSQSTHLEIDNTHLRFVSNINAIENMVIEMAKNKYSKYYGIEYNDLRQFRFKSMIRRGSVLRVPHIKDNTPVFYHHYKISNRERIVNLLEKDAKVTLLIWVKGIWIIPSGYFGIQLVLDEINIVETAPTFLNTYAFIDDEDD